LVKTETLPIETIEIENLRKGFFLIALVYNGKNGNNGQQKFVSKFIKEQFAYH
jgi:hypothetical protein